MIIFPHLLALHAIVLLSALAWLLSFSAWQERRRTSIVQIAIVGYAALVAASLAQALGGRAPFDLSGPLAVLFWISTAVVAGALITTLGRLHPTGGRPEHDLR